MHLCQFCERSFARTEHLVRHQRIHTGERPFQCLHCQADFQRADVLLRHVKKVHVAVHTAADKPVTKARSRLVCDQCRQRKLKCDSDRPCGTCRSKLLDCTASESAKPRSVRRQALQARPFNDTSMHVEQSDAAHVNKTASLYNPPDLGMLSPLRTTVQSSLPAMHDAIRESDGLQRVDDGHFTLGSSEHTLVIPSDNITSNTHDISDNYENLPMISAHFEDINVPIDFLDDFMVPTDFGFWFDDEQCQPNSGEVAGLPVSQAAKDVDGYPMLSSSSSFQKQLPQCLHDSLPLLATRDGAFYSAAPHFDVYDDDSVNILLNLAKRHLAPTFLVFSEFQARPSDRVELVLAMAAVGALYSAVPESPKFSKMLYNDARRLLLESYLCEAEHSVADQISFAKTFTLLEVYGFCGGDKRAYEWNEFFNGSKMLVMEGCMDMFNTDITLEQRRQIQLVLQAVKVLDAYRVLILRRPPSITDQRRAEIIPKDLICLPPATNRPGEAVNSAFAQWNDLTAAVSKSWMPSFGDGETSPGPLWKVEYAELALHRWLSSGDSLEQDETPTSASQIMLFHLTQVLLHSSVRTLRRYCCAAVHGPTPLSKLPRTPEISPQPWANAYRYKKALWHANTIIRLADDAVTPWRPRNQSSMRCLVYAEPPHLSLCIFFATLVSWYGSIRDSPKEPLAGDSVIDSACRILLALKTPVAESLKAMLQQMLSVHRDQAV